MWTLTGVQRFVNSYKWNSIEVDLASACEVERLLQQYQDRTPMVPESKIFYTAPMRMIHSALAALLSASAVQAGAPEPLDQWAASARRVMVDLLASYSPEHRVTDPKVLEAMREVPRHEFVPEALVRRAYDDGPLPIGEGQTISQPLIVGLMTEALALRPSDKVFEVGTGSGYQAAILAKLAKEVYTVEIVPSLARRAERTLRRLGYANVRVRIGDGYAGWPEKAPFDAIIVTCAPDHIPPPLIAQLKTGGRMIIPVGPEAGGAFSAQELIVVRKTPKGMEREKRMDVRFVPMTGKGGRP